MRAFTERSQSERTAAEGEEEGGKEKRGGREDSELERERGREGGWGVVIAGSFQALEVEKEEKRKISCCFKKERRDRERVWISELLNSPPLSLLHGLLIWDLFKSGTAPQEDFSLLGKGNPAPSLSHYTHPHIYTDPKNV